MTQEIERFGRIFEAASKVETERAAFKELPADKKTALSRPNHGLRAKPEYKRDLRSAGVLNKTYGL